jgi:RecA-family ATPase
LVLNVARFELLHRPPDSSEGAIQKTPLYHELVTLIGDEKIGLLIIDPLIETHVGLDENSNTDMKEVILGLRDLANRARCCVLVIHHSRKGQIAGDQDSARGGSALVNACRVAMTLDPMSESEAKLLPPTEADERWRYVKLCGAKANYTGRGSERWLRLESIHLRNSGSPEGDSSPGMVAVDLQREGVLTDEQRMRVLNEVEMAAASKNWLRASKSGTEGRLDLRMMKILDIGKEIAGQIMKQLLEHGWIEEEEVTGQDRHKRKGLVVARWPEETCQREDDLPF